MAGRGRPSGKGGGLLGRNKSTGGKGRGGRRGGSGLDLVKRGLGLLGGSGRKNKKRKHKDQLPDWDKVRIQGRQDAGSDQAPPTTVTDPGQVDGPQTMPVAAETAVITEGMNDVPNPFDSHNEALAASTSNLDIENARGLIDWVDNAPGAAETQAAMWTGHAHKIQEQILIGAEFAEALHDFAATQARQAERIREVGATFRRVHAEELRRINEPKPGEDKWDIGKNRL